MSKQLNGLSALFDLVGVLARRRFQVGERAFASLGLNHSEARLLTLLHMQHGEAKQEVLSNMLSVDRSNAGRALKGLESKGYVCRVKDDSNGRTRLVSMTSQGREATTAIERLRTEMAKSFFGDLKEEEARLIVNLLRTSLTLSPAITDEDRANHISEEVDQ
ncbi:MAG: MarR family transcriptional regulator [Armatimonadetes bacterium]|nr:MarR family transcriptional regulator [Armatimonadota bacterium]